MEAYMFKISCSLHNVTVPYNSYNKDAQETKHMMEGGNQYQLHFNAPCDDIVSLQYQYVVDQGHCI